jgi:dynein heavy chain
LVKSDLILLLRRLSLSSNKTSSRLPTLKRLEEELLFKLTNAQGDILSDIALIENLETSKKISLEIAAKVIIAKAIGKIINEASEAHRIVATRGALIFFLMNNLYKIHTFYMYSFARVVRYCGR